MSNFVGKYRRIVFVGKSLTFKAPCAKSGQCRWQVSEQRSVSKDPWAKLRLAKFLQPRGLTIRRLLTKYIAILDELETLA